MCRISTSRPTPRPTDPVDTPSAPAIVVIVVSLTALIESVWPLVGVYSAAWLIWLPAPIWASASRWKSLTMNEPAIATSPSAAAPATATDVACGSRVDERQHRWSTDRGGSRHRSKWRPRHRRRPRYRPSSNACSTATLIVAPIDVPSEKAPAAASVCGSSAAFAVTLMPPLDSRCESLAAEASVSNVSMTLIATDPAMLVSPLPPAAAAPQAMKSSVLPEGVTASIVMPLPCMTEPSPPLSTSALLVAWT